MSTTTVPFPDIKNPGVRKNLRLDGHVGLDGDGPASARFDLAHHCLGRRAVALVIHGHGITLARRQTGQRSANAPAAARDQQNLAHILPPAQSRPIRYKAAYQH